jgi:hypothetical protein
MKNQLLFVLVLFFSSTIYSQVIYKNAKSKDFISLLDNGILFMPTGKKEIDESYINALKENWKISKFSVYDTDENEEIALNQIVVFEAKINETESVLALINFESILKGNVSKYACLGYICLNGFNQLSDDITKKTFANQSIIGIHDALLTVNNGNITKGGVGLFKEIFKMTLPKAKELKDKTLLIIDETKSYIDLNALNRNGIRYKLISLDEFSSIDKEELSLYCLMYFAFNSYTEISIFDLENNELIYTQHFASSKFRFSSSDIKKISNLWK